MSPGVPDLCDLASEDAQTVADCSDLYRDNIGKERFGVEVWDGSTRTHDIIVQSDVVLFAGTTLQNGTFDDIRAHIQT
ncbi:hypothetical protein ACFL5O_06280 [Myxococcota bacterium]